MATYFSDHFSVDGANRTAWVRDIRPSAGIAGGRLRISIGRVTGVQASQGPPQDQVRFLTLHSGDYLHQVWWAHTGNGAAGVASIGWYQRGQNHDGVVVDAVMHGNARSLSAAADGTDTFNAAGSTARGQDRGMRLWELASLASDPYQEWDLTYTCTTSADAAEDTTMYVVYTDGS